MPVIYCMFEVCIVVFHQLIRTLISHNMLTGYSFTILREHGAKWLRPVLLFKVLGF